MKPICVPCRRFFRPSHTGRYFVEGMPTQNGVLPGNAEPNKWKPYKLWSGDEWQCRGCGATIIVGFGAGPIAERHHDGFAETVAALGNGLQVNDC